MPKGKHEMNAEVNMLQTSIGLKREFTTDGDAYFVLEIGMDPETRVSIVEPDKGDWLYFVAVNPDTGETKFTADYNEFLEFKAEFEEYIAKNP